MLDLLETGRWAGQESALVDLKEEAGRRDKAGTLLPGTPENDRAADQVAEEAACMANTPGGGALVVGATNDGDLIGTALAEQWLRHRVYEKTQRALTIEVQAVLVQEVRLLVVTAPQAIEPIRWRGRVRWRVDDHCVEVDPATWHAQRMIRSNYDWSAEASHVSVEEAREASIDVARRLLRESSEARSLELAMQPSPELLRRLNVVTGDGMLTNAGVIAFVGRTEPGLDYIRRETAGGDSRQRASAGSRGLLEELHEAFTFIAANNAVRHLPRGITVAQIQDLPERAVREAVVNGLAHRDWLTTQPTTVEHIGRTLRVTSPGGFYGGVNAGNIITHPSVSRNRSLAELFAALRVAEREGVGVDQMVLQMLRLGHMAPEIEEIPGPYVRVSLVGDAADTGWIDWLGSIEPVGLVDDLNNLLLLRRLVGAGWVDSGAAAPLVQLNRAETEGAIRRLGSAQIGGDQVVRLVKGIPDDHPPAWTLSPAARQALQRRDASAGISRVWPTRRSLALSFAGARGRNSSTELGALAGASPTNVGGVLKDLETDGYLAPARPSRRGPGFYYVFTGEAATSSQSSATRG